ncbi:MAG: PKD domain-containing protein [Flavobacterium sp.]
MKTIKFLNRFLMIGIILIAAACQNEDAVVIAPTTEDAAFTYTVDADNPNKIIFHSDPDESNWYTHWAFGDNSSAEGNDTSKIFTKKGTYNVRFKIFTEAGTAESIQTIVIENDYKGEPVLLNGFNSSTGWTIVNHNGVSNTWGSVTIADGVAKFDESSTSEWKHMGIYTPLTLQPGTYQFDMEMAYKSLNNVWGEVYIGATQPVDGSDYGGGQGAQLVIKAYNSWDCSGITTYSGLATESGCDSNALPGQFKITTAGTYYLMIRTGGQSYGPDGIVIDNVSLYKTN